MKLFNADAMRRAHDPARSDRASAAHDLVRRTLATHGLLPDAGAPFPRAPMPNIRSLLTASSATATSRQQVLPEGAEYRTDTFSCEAGSRVFRTYVPASAKDGANGLVVMLHGCTQTADDFAAGTGMNELAEKAGLIIVYPEQSRVANAQTCWNWFSKGDQRRGRGEPAILAGLTRQVAGMLGDDYDAEIIDFHLVSRAPIALN